MGAADGQGGVVRKGVAQHDTQLSSCHGGSDVLVMHPEDWSRSSCSWGGGLSVLFQLCHDGLQ